MQLRMTKYNYDAIKCDIIVLGFFLKLKNV
jgi:hypothetical protein